MRSNAHLKAVNLPPFISTAKDRTLDNDIEVMDNDIEVMDMLIEVYKAEMVRIVLDVCVIGCLLLVVCRL
jgi:hypothetical protein